jgi:hypothetical protein
MKCMYQMPPLHDTFRRLHDVLLWCELFLWLEKGGVGAVMEAVATWGVVSMASIASLGFGRER